MADSADEYKIGVILRNMGLASLLTFLVPVVACWSMGLTIQLSIISRKIYEATHNQEYKKISDCQLAVAIVGLAATIGLMIMIFVPVYHLYLSGISYNLDMREFYQRILIVGTVITAGCVCIIGVVLNTATWMALENGLKSSATGDVLQKGLNGVKRGKVAQVMALIVISLVIPAAIIANYQIENIGTLLGSSDPLDRLIYFLGILIMFGIAAIIALVFCSLQITAFFTTGSAFLKTGRDEEIVDTTTLDAPVVREAPNQSPTTGEAFKIVFCHNCGKQLGENHDFQFCPYCAMEIMKL